MARDDQGCVKCKPSQNFSESDSDGLFARYVAKLRGDVQCVPLLGPLNVLCLKISCPDKVRQLDRIMYAVAGVKCSMRLKDVASHQAQCRSIPTCDKHYSLAMCIRLRHVCPFSLRPSCQVGMRML